MTLDGETVLLWQSIGSWTLECRSHDVIGRGRVLRAGAWSDERIAAERRRDERAKAEFYDHELVDIATQPEPLAPMTFVWAWISGGS